MTDLKLTQSFSMIALNAQNSIYMTTVKKVGLRCMAAAVILEIYLDKGFIQTEDKLIIKKDVFKQSSTMNYYETILKPLLHKNVEVKRDLKWWLKKVSMSSRKKLIKFEHIGSGLNFAFPILERSQSVFIDTEQWFSNPHKRLENVKKRLVSNGHEFTVLYEGAVPVIKIDNIIYEAIPEAITMRVPIHGVRLLPRRSI